MYFQTRINLTEEFGIFLQVRGGLDIVNGRATWEFQSIDPDTGRQSRFSFNSTDILGVHFDNECKQLLAVTQVNHQSVIYVTQRHRLACASD